MTDPDNTPEQARLASIAFRYDVHLALIEASRCIRSRDLKAAIRPAAQAVDRYARYLWASLTARVGSSTSLTIVLGAASEVDTSL